MDKFDSTVVQILVSFCLFHWEVHSRCVLNMYYICYWFVMYMYIKKHIYPKHSFRKSRILLYCVHIYTCNTLWVKCFVCYYLTNVEFCLIIYAITCIYHQFYYWLFKHYTLTSLLYCIVSSIQKTFESLFYRSVRYIYIYKCSLLYIITQRSPVLFLLHFCV